MYLLWFLAVGLLIVTLQDANIHSEHKVGTERMSARHHATQMIRYHQAAVDFYRDNSGFIGVISSANITAGGYFPASLQVPTWTVSQVFNNGVVTHATGYLSPGLLVSALGEVASGEEPTGYLSANRAAIAGAGTSSWSSLNTGRAEAALIQSRAGAVTNIPADPTVPNGSPVIFEQVF